jgi:hypothetical protein
MSEVQGLSFLWRFQLTGEEEICYYRLKEKEPFYNKKYRKD